LVQSKLPLEPAERLLGYEVPPQPESHEGQHLEYEAHLIARWTKLCFEKHTVCGNTTQYLPTRAVAVGSLHQPELRLLPSSSIQDTDRRYLALSHCWGLTMPESGKTTQTSLESHQARIAYHDLPLTFRDFIDIARRLDVRYVWIDSLCILQDSKED
jgi:hypothetical protein